MRAITYAAFGGPEVLTLTDLPAPTPAADQVVVQVAAWVVNPYDTKVRSGRYANGKPVTAPRRIGFDFAGSVVEVGTEVHDLQVGDSVVGSAPGSSAELIAVKVGKLVRLDPALDPVIAATVPVAGGAAVRVLRLSGAAAGQTLLVHAATGGVGTFLVQLARAAGITVIGTTGPATIDFLAGLGAIPVVYGDGWQDRVRAAASGPVDAVVDAIGGGVAEQSLEVVKPGGAIVTLVDFDARGPGIVATDGSEPGFENVVPEALAAVADGRVTVQIDSRFRFADYAEAHRRSETGQARGKIVIVP